MYAWESKKRYWILSKKYDKIMIVSFQQESVDWNKENEMEAIPEDAK